MSSNFLKFHVSCFFVLQLTSFLGIIPNKEIFNNSSSLQKNVHYREIAIGKKRKSVERKKENLKKNM